jgi:WbqC-like protein family.
MTTALLQTTYFGPVQWYQKLYRYDHCLIEQYDSYQKQTYRNRCVIATANGLQALTVPVEHNSQLSIINYQLVKDLRISDHNQWRRIHWNALQSAYSESPFFDYYADDIRPFYERKYEFLIDFNEEIRQKICELIDIHPNVEYTKNYIHSPLTIHHSPLDDFREVIHAKHPQADADFEPRPYWQVFQHRYGFQPNLSILDLLFCMGPESIFYL